MGGGLAEHEFALAPVGKFSAVFALFLLILARDGCAEAVFAHCRRTLNFAIMCGV